MPSKFKTQGVSATIANPDLESREAKDVWLSKVDIEWELKPIERSWGVEDFMVRIGSISGNLIITPKDGDKDDASEEYDIPLKDYKVSYSFTNDRGVGISPVNVEINELDKNVTVLFTINAAAATRESGVSEDDTEGEEQPNLTSVELAALKESMQKLFRVHDGR